MSKKRNRQLGELQVLALAWVKDAHRQAEIKDATRREAIQLSRDFGLSWDAIGEAMGMSRQATHKRFAQQTDEPDDEMRHRVERLRDIAESAGNGRHVESSGGTT